MLTADKVLVTVGTPCSISAVGSTETYHARVTQAPEFIAYAAFDAGLIDIEPGAGGALAVALARWHTDHDRRDRAPPRRTAAREPRHPLRRRADCGGLVRRHGYRRAAAARFRERRPAQARPASCIATSASPPSRTCTGCSTTIRVSARRCRRSCSRTAASARSPRCRSRWPSCCRIRTSSAWPARLRSWAWTRSPSCAARAREGIENDKLRDKFAMRLANSLSSHGPALLSTMLAPSYSLSKSLKNPALLDSLRSASGYMRVPQTPLNAVGACASSSIVFCEFAPQMVLDYPGYQRPTMTLWTAADAATRPSWQILEAFGPGALMTRAKLTAMNAGRAPVATARGGGLPGAVRHRRERHGRRRRRLGRAGHDARLRAAQLPRHHVDHRRLGPERRDRRQGALRRRRLRRRERADPRLRSRASRPRLRRRRLPVPGRPRHRHAHQLEDRPHDRGERRTSAAERQGRKGACRR